MAIDRDDSYEAVPDVLDQASMLQDRTNQEAVRKIQEQQGPETHPDFDGESCVGCHNEIPQARLKLGKVRCVACQAVLERIGKIYGGRK